MTAPSNLARASYRLRHSLLRRAAGEHSLPTNELAIAFATEWCLGPLETAKLYRKATQWDAALTAGEKAL